MAKQDEQVTETTQTEAAEQSAPKRKDDGKVTVAGKVSKETAEKLEEMRWSRRLPKGAAVEAAIEFWVNNAPAV
jgi:methylmalonyl-CoA mutase cobalamin-binding subunit